MINNEQAKELLDAIENYGDKERLYGAESAKHDLGRSTQEDVTQRDNAASRDLHRVKLLLSPHLADPAGPDGTFNMSRAEDESENATDTPEVTWWSER